MTTTDTIHEDDVLDRLASVSEENNPFTTLPALLSVAFGEFDEGDRLDLADGIVPLYRSIANYGRVSQRVYGDTRDLIDALRAVTNALESSVEIATESAR